MTGIELIAKERQEQIEKHGRSIKADACLNDKGQLIRAVEYLISDEEFLDSIIEDMEYRDGLEPSGWNKQIYTKMLQKPYLQRLIIAGALIAAEIDRLNYKP